MTLRAMFYTRRNRNLAVLAGVALAFSVLAIAAVHHRADVMAPQHTAKTLFPGLARELNAGEITHIRIASKKDGELEIAFLPSKGWVLPGRANFPASFEEVKKTLVALAAMETIEPKTDNPELFHFVDLDAPPAGGGIAVTLLSDKGQVRAALIIGKSDTIGDDGVGLFVRKPGENQSWLVKSPSAIRSNAADWMDKTVLDIDRARVAAVEVQPMSGPAYTASRAKPDNANFAVTPLPKGRELAYAGAADTLASALDDFSFDDIKPATDFDFTRAAHLVSHTYDGLTVTADVVKQGADTWVRVVAAAQPGNQTAAREAIAINGRAAGWAYKLPAYKGASFVPALETLLKPKGK